MAARKLDRLETLYLVNLCLLATHEIDSAYWHEWNLFGIPGGIQVFLVLNFFMLLVPMFGLRQLVLGLRSGLYYSLLVSAAGLFAFGVHTTFIVLGHPEFRLPVSLLVLVLTLLASIFQGKVTLARLRG